MADNNLTELRALLASPAANGPAPGPNTLAGRSITVAKPGHTTLTVDPPQLKPSVNTGEFWGALALTFVPALAEVAAPYLHQGLEVAAGTAIGGPLVAVAMLAGRTWLKAQALQAAAQVGAAQVAGPQEVPSYFPPQLNPQPPQDPIPAIDVNPDPTTLVSEDQLARLIREVVAALPGQQPGPNPADHA